LAQHAVHVERIGVEIEIEALRQDDLEDVAGDDVFLRDVHGALVMARRHVRSCSRQRVGRVGRSYRGVRQWPSERDDRGVEPGDGVVVGLIERVAVEAEHRHVLDHVRPLTPVVERSQRTDHAHHRVRQATVVRRHVGQPLDLADDVVAEKADDTAVQRWQLGHRRRAIRRQQRVERGEHAAIEWHRRRDHPVDHDAAVAHHERGRRVAPDEGEAAPPFGVLDRLE
jgi:hypothetical protein